MTRRQTIVALLALIIVGVVAWKLRQAESGAPAPAASPEPGRKSFRGPGNSASGNTERSALADGLNSPATDIRADLRLVSDAVDTFRSNFPRDGNPVGSNAEITAALTGKNKLRLALIPPDHPAINAAGELCDRWGTPFFFHAESANKMEIRSAGPDRKMWNEDDVTFAP